MPYTIYKRVNVLEIRQQEVVRQRRPQEIADPFLRRADHVVTVARFQRVDYEATIGDFKGHFRQGDLVSVAVNDKWDVIAVVNHTTGQSAGLKYSSMSLSDIGGILFFVSIPTLICLGIAWKMWNTHSYHDKAWIPVAIAVVAAGAIGLGLNKDFVESKRALREMA